jgi:hypothetical protein
MPNKDPFRTLDDPEPPAVTSSALDPQSIKKSQIQAGSISSGAYYADGLRAGIWRMKLPAGRPSWLRRLFVWLLLGWKWEQ